RRAVGVHAAAAIFAFAASGDAGDQYGVAWIERADTGSRLLDHAHAFMSQDAPAPTRRNIALENVKIGAADCRFGIFTIASVGALRSGRGRSSSAFCPGP